MREKGWPLCISYPKALKTKPNKRCYFPSEFFYRYSHKFRLCGSSGQTNRHNLLLLFSWQLIKLPHPPHWQQAASQLEGMQTAVLLMKIFITKRRHPLPISSEEEVSFLWPISAVIPFSVPSALCTYLNHQLYFLSLFFQPDFPFSVPSTGFSFSVLFAAFSYLCSLSCISFLCSFTRSFQFFILSGKVSILFFSAEVSPFCSNRRSLRIQFSFFIQPHEVFPPLRNHPLLIKRDCLTRIKVGIAIYKSIVLFKG